LSHAIFLPTTALEILVANASWYQALVPSVVFVVDTAAVMTPDLTVTLKNTGTLPSGVRYVTVDDFVTAAGWTGGVDVGGGFIGLVVGGTIGVLIWVVVPV
jgi:hypothetical protein